MVKLFYRFKMMLGREIKKKYKEVYLIISPPRCASTAVARIFWEFQEVGYYSHEPYECLYYSCGNIEDVHSKLLNPIEMNDNQEGGCRGLVIKEMPYQVGERFPELVDIATKPILFLVRDPRLNISSRIRKKREVGDKVEFPLIESGWKLLEEQVNYCKKNSIKYFILETTNLRNNPEYYVRRLCKLYKEQYSQNLLNWDSKNDLKIDNLEGAHNHLYQKVLSSKGILPALEVPLELDWFLEYFKEHLIDCLQIYKSLLEDPMVIN